MNSHLFSRLFLPIGVVSLLTWAMVMPMVNAQDAQPSVTPDIDITIPRIRVRPPVSEPTLKLYETLPAQFYFNMNGESSVRLETNPYQAPDSATGFTDSTEALRFQGDVTLGYAFTPRTRAQLGYFVLNDRFNNYSPSRLDSTAQSLSATVEHDLLQKN
jgi:hypothetical protein